MPIIRWPRMALLFSAMICVGDAAMASPMGTLPIRRSFETLSDSDPLRTDSLIRMYAQRVEQAKARRGQKEETLKVLKIDRWRTETLYKANAVSAEELDMIRQEVEIAALQTQDLEFAIKEAEALLDIAVDRISIGLDMPICVPTNL